MFLCGIHAYIWFIEDFKYRYYMSYNELIPKFVFGIVANKIYQQINVDNLKFYAI